MLAVTENDEWIFKNSTIPYYHTIVTIKPCTPRRVIKKQPSLPLEVTYIFTSPHFLTLFYIITTDGRALSHRNSEALDRRKASSRFRSRDKSILDRGEVEE